MQYVVHVFMLIGVVILCIMVYNYHTKPRVSNVLWYANVKPTYAELHQKLMSSCTRPECPECYRDAYDTVVNGNRYWKSTTICDGQYSRGTIAAEMKGAKA